MTHHGSGRYFHVLLCKRVCGPRKPLLLSTEVALAARRAQGASMKELADCSGRSMAGVSALLASVTRKLMLHDDAHLVALLGDNSSSASLTPPSALEALVVEMNGQERLLFVYPRPDWALPASLSPAEGCIVRGLLSGASHSEIARARGTSPRTVANQMASIFRKLHVGSRLELFVLLRRGVGAESPIMGH